MYLFVIAMALQTFSGASAQIIDSQAYCNRFGNQLVLRQDSTFHHSWAFDLTYRWSTGRWLRQGNLIILKPEIVYDTVFTGDDENLTVRHLAPAYFPKATLRKAGEIERMSPSFQQGEDGTPDSLLVRKHRLYEIRNGKLLKRRFPVLKTQGRKIPASYRICSPRPL